MTRRHGRNATLATLALVAALATAPAGTAAAGEYEVYSCRTPTGQVAPTDGWTAPGHSGEDTTSDTCEQPGGGLVAGLDDGSTHLAHSALDKASWIFDAPVGEAIVAAKLWRAGATAGGSNEHAYYALYMETAVNGEDEAFDVCAASRPCTSVGEANDPLASKNLVTAPENVLPSSLISLNAACGSAIDEYACPEGKSDPGGYAATVELFAADLVLSQPQGPEVASGVGGSLAEAPTVSGRADLAFEASDAGSGVYEVVFRVDGEVVSTVVPEEEGGRCRNLNTGAGLPAFLYTQPCPSALSVDLPFDTTGLTDGTHELLVTVLDAAGNSATVLKRKIDVANSAAPGGSEPGGGPGGSSNGSGAEKGGGVSGGAGSGAGGSGGAGAGSGSGGSGDAGAGGPAPTATGAAVGPANGVGASDQAVLTAAWRGHRGESLAGAFGAARAVEGRLTTAAGAPIVDAEVEVGERPAYTGAPEHALGVARTGADGRWRLALPRGISSGVLSVAYRSHLGDATPVATRTLTLAVGAGLRLSIAPRLAPARGAIRFSGRLLGGPVPAGGKQVVLEARSPGGRWLEFHVVRGAARRDGRFEFVYRFRLAGPATYQFRALSEAEADYPFAAGSSNVVRVRER